MSNTVELKDNHLHITYEVYDYGPKQKRKIIPIKDIECIKARVGSRGGMHTWDLRGDSVEYRDIYPERDVPIFSGDRKNSDLIEKIMVLLPDIKYLEETENGGAPW
jgi:hypothetical protein